MTNTSLPPGPVTVKLKHEEVLAAAISSRSRGQGVWRWFGFLLFLSLCLAIWLGHLAAFWLVQRLPFALMFVIGPDLPVLIAAAFCMVAVSLVLRLEQRRAERRYLRYLAAIGSPLERDATYEITEDALALTTERIAIAPRWHAIDTVERGTHGWVISADQLHFLIPFADFPTNDAQRPLVAAIVSRLGPEARARSREAIEFASSEPSRTTMENTFVSPWKNGDMAPASQDFASEPDLPLARGWLTQEQAGWAAGRVFELTARPRFHRWAYPMAGMVTGILLATTVLGTIFVFLPPEVVYQHPQLISLIGLAVPSLTGLLGLVLANKRLGIVLNKAWYSGLADRGVPDQIEATWSLTPTGLAYHTPRFEAVAPYGAIHQVLHEGPYWIVAADALTLCIPEAAFATPRDEAAFFNALLERLDEPARGRSSEKPVLPDPT